MKDDVFQKPLPIILYFPYITSQKKDTDTKAMEVSYMNLIFIMADTFRADNLGCYGGKEVKTPNLDRLAEESVVFDNCYAEGLPTIPVRRALFTGKRTFPWVDWKPSREMPWIVPGWQPLAESDVTLTEILKSKGYKTGFITDTYHFFAPTMNFHRAFDSWLWIRGQEIDRYKIPPPESRSSYEANYKANVADRRYEEDYFAPQVFHEGIKWLEENYHHKKFFLYIDSFDPHEPWDPPLHYLRMYEKVTEHEPEGAHGEKLTETQKKQMRAHYWGEVTMVDRWIGLLLDKVGDLGLLDDTLIIFMSDHGTLLGEHDLWHKPPNSVYEPLIRLPLIVRFPGKEYKGRRVKSFIQTHDILPTLLHILEIKEWPYLKRQINGLDGFPLITREKEKIRDYIICGYEVYTCVRDYEWHYIISDQWEDPPVRYWRGRRLPRGEWLFNLKEDPACNIDVSEKYPETLEMMRKRLKKLLLKYGVQDFPMKTYAMYPKKGFFALSTSQ